MYGLELKKECVSRVELEIGKISWNALKRKMRQISWQRSMCDQSTVFQSSFDIDF